MKTQNAQVLRWLNEVGPITPVDALRQFGIMRLGARVHELKRVGHNIQTETETAINRFGKIVRYARYRLVR